MIKSVLTESRAKEIKSFLSGAIAKRNIEKKAIDIIVKVEKEYIDSEFIVATIHKVDGVLSIMARTKKGKHKEYKTIRGVVNFLSREYGSCNGREYIEKMLNELNDMGIKLQNTMNIVRQEINIDEESKTVEEKLQKLNETLSIVYNELYEDFASGQINLPYIRSEEEGIDIIHPFYTECMRFDINPFEYYGATMKDIEKFFKFYGIN